MFDEGHECCFSRAAIGACINVRIEVLLHCNMVYAWRWSLNHDQIHSPTPLPVLWSAALGSNGEPAVTGSPAASDLCGLSQG